MIQRVEALLASPTFRVWFIVGIVALAVLALAKVNPQ
jgi:hypothetical protein